MRYGKLLLGSCVILVSVWIIIGEQISGVSSDAVVNARLGTLRAPRAGTLEMTFRAFGTEMSAGEEVAVLTSTDVDVARLDDLLTEEALAVADIKHLMVIRDLTREAASLVEAGVQIASNDGVSSTSGIAFDTRGFPEADLQRAHERLFAIQASIERERIRLGEQGSMNLSAPIDGVLWEVLAGDGEYVERGQDIAKFMVCGSELVTLSVPDYIYARLSVGQNAAFRLDGFSTVYNGTITRMAGAGAETIYRNLAVAPSLKHLERYDIALLVPMLRTDPDLRCSVGRTGRVFFDSRPLDWLRASLR
jgi:hypothetical protein